MGRTSKSQECWDPLHTGVRLLLEQEGDSPSIPNLYWLWRLSSQVSIWQLTRIWKSEGEIIHTNSCPHTRMMRERIPVQPKQRLVRLPLQLIPLRFNIPHLHIHAFTVEPECGDVAVAINRNVVWVGRNEGIAYDAVKGPINFFGDGAEDAEISYLALESAWRA